MTRYRAAHHPSTSSTPALSARPAHDTSPADAAPAPPDPSRTPSVALSANLPRQHITSYPIAQGRYVNVVPTYSDFTQDRTHIASCGAGSKAANDEILPYFEGWEELATVLVENFKCIGKWPIMQLSPLPRYADGRIILLGNSVSNVFSLLTG